MPVFRILFAPKPTHVKVLIVYRGLQRFQNFFTFKTKIEFIKMKKNSKNGLPASQPASQRGTAEATLISRAKVNDTTFRILVKLLKILSVFHIVSFLL